MVRYCLIVSVIKYVRLWARMIKGFVNGRLGSKKSGTLLSGSVNSIRAMSDTNVTLTFIMSKPQPVKLFSLAKYVIPEKGKSYIACKHLNVRLWSILLVGFVTGRMGSKKSGR